MTDKEAWLHDAEDFGRPSDEKISVAVVGNGFDTNFAITPEQARAMFLALADLAEYLPEKEAVDAD